MLGVLYTVHCTLYTVVFDSKVGCGLALCIKWTKNDNAMGVYTSGKMIP